MKQLKLFAAIITTTLILLTSCKKEVPQDTTIENDAEVNAQSARLSPALRAKLARLRTSLPAGSEKRLKINSQLLIKIHPDYKFMIDRAMRRATASTCDDNTEVRMWLNKQISDWDNDVIYFALITGMLDLPTYDALLFENKSDGQYFGINQQYTHLQDKTFKDLKRFWDIQSQNIVLAGMHGNMLSNREKLIRIDIVLFGDSPSLAGYWADLILSLLRDIPQYRNGNHPIFTFNSYAQPAFQFPNIAPIPDKIIMGDGILQAFDEVGYNDVSSQAILAHEFGHHIQFQLNLLTSNGTPEENRRAELMADAFSSYYLSHARGAAMQWKRVKQFLQVFYNIGDCSIASSDHHGTPSQRLAAAQWAYELADKAKKQGHILSSASFAAMFDAALPVILLH